jgi:hypothetical protein
VTSTATATVTSNAIRTNVCNFSPDHKANVVPSSVEFRLGTVRDTLKSFYEIDIYQAACTSAWQCQALRPMSLLMTNEGLDICELLKASFFYRSESVSDR